MKNIIDSTCRLSEPRTIQCFFNVIAFEIVLHRLVPMLLNANVCKNHYLPLIWYFLIVEN